MTAYRKVWKTSDLEEMFDLPESLQNQKELEVIILPMSAEQEMRSEETVYFKKILKEDYGLLQRLSE